MTPTIKQVTNALEHWAPRATAESYDNVGLQVGDAGARVETGLIALDLTPAVVDEALEKNVQLIITHHPLIFRPLKTITAADWHGALVLNLARAGIALYCIHTNLDAAHQGVSFVLAAQLGLKDVSFLSPKSEALYKLVTFVPNDHADAVRQALAAAGAGQIGDYSACAFTLEGTGYFRPGASTNPLIGTAGGPAESATELRLEVEVSRWQLAAVRDALFESHPYDEVAYDVYHVEQPHTRVGMGAIGHLADAMTLGDFLEQVKHSLESGSLRYAGHNDALVQRIAVCGGSGSSLLPHAQRAGADAFVTADVTYHRYFDVLDPSGTPTMALIDAGHYETEATTERLLVDWLSERFQSSTWLRTKHRTSPMQTYTGC